MHIQSNDAATLLWLAMYYSQLAMILNSLHEETTWYKYVAEGGAEMILHMYTLRSIQNLVPLQKMHVGQWSSYLIF